MTYQPHTWTKGETITAQLLQNMDNGVAAAIDALESAFGSNYTMGSKEYKVNFTNLGKDISANAIQGTTLTATSAISGNTLDITTDSDLKGDVDIGGTLTVEQIKAGETDDIQLNGKLIVIGKDAEVDNSTVKQAASFTGTLNVSGATALDDQLTVTGDTILKGNLTVGNETATGKKAIRLNDTIKIDTDSSNRIIIGGQTQINAPVTIGNSQTYHAVKIYGIPTIYGQTLSITNPSMKPMIKLKPTGEITAKTLVIDNELTIGTASSQTAEATGSTRLYGTTTIDKLIVGDSTTNKNNEINGFTTISNLVVGKPNVQSNSETQTYSGTATFNTNENILRGDTTLGLYTDGPYANLNNEYYMTTSGRLRIYSKDIEIGLTGQEEVKYQESAGQILNNSTTIIHGSTTIDNLTVNAITLNAGIHISEYASGNNSYGLIVEKPSLIYGNIKLGTNDNNIHISKLNNTNKNTIKLSIAANSDANETFETEINGLLRIQKSLVSRKDTVLGSENPKAYCDAQCSGRCTGSCVTYCTGGCSEACTAACSDACGQGCKAACTIQCQGTAMSVIRPSVTPSNDILKYTGTALFNTETTTIHGSTEIDNLTIKNNITFTDGTDTVTLSIAELQELKTLLSESNGGE